MSGLFGAAPRVNGDEWCILRTAGPRTLQLAKSLGDAGIETWTPQHTTRIRVPRSKRMVERHGPILPTFVFARADRITDLLRILAMPVNPHPRFSIMRHDGRVPVIADQEMNSLRAAEESARRAILKKRRHVIEPGTRVRMEEGSYAGLRGVVKRGDGKFALVSLGGRLNVKVATFLLLPDDVSIALDSPVTGPAALAA